MQRTPRQCTLKANETNSSGGPSTSSKQDRPIRNSPYTKENPYMKQESSFTVRNLNKALTDMKETMKVFKELRETHNLGAQHFSELENKYEELMAAAQTGKTEKNVFLMKKTTATLEIMLFDLKKGNKTFERRYKKLIAQAKAEREGRTVEEADEDQNDDDDTEQDEQDDDYYGMQDH